LGKFTDKFNELPPFLPFYVFYLTKADQDVGMRPLSERIGDYALVVVCVRAVRHITNLQFKFTDLGNLPDQST
jgi:hypothetical protein